MGIPETLGTIGGIPAPSGMRARRVIPEQPGGIRAGGIPRKPSTSVPDEPVDPGGPPRNTASGCFSRGSVPDEPIGGCHALGIPDEPTDLGDPPH